MNKLYFTRAGFLHLALAHEGIILLILHIHMYFRYTKTQVYTSKLYRILVQ